VTVCSLHKPAFVELFAEIYVSTFMAFCFSVLLPKVPNLCLGFTNAPLINPPWDNYFVSVDLFRYKNSNSDLPIAHSFWRCIFSPYKAGSSESTPCFQTVSTPQPISNLLLSIYLQSWSEVCDLDSSIRSLSLVLRLWRVLHKTQHALWTFLQRHADFHVCWE